MSEIYEENGIIEQIFFSTEPTLTHWVQIEFRSGGCLFGGYALKEEGCSIWIDSLMKVLGVDRLNDETAVGKVVRVRNEGIGGRIVAIGHPIKEIWMDPETLFAAAREKRELSE